MNKNYLIIATLLFTSVFAMENPSASSSSITPEAYTSPRTSPRLQITNSSGHAMTLALNALDVRALIQPGASIAIKASLNDVRLVHRGHPYSLSIHPDQTQDNSLQLIIRD